MLSAQFGAVHGTLVGFLFDIILIGGYFFLVVRTIHTGYAFAPVAQQPYRQPVGQPVYQQPVAQPAAQQPYQQPVAQPAAQQPYQQPVAQQPAAQQPYRQPVDQPVYQQPVAQPAAQQPFQQPVAQPAAQQPYQQSVAQQPAAQQLYQQPVAQQPAAQQPYQQPVAQQPAAQQPYRQPVGQPVYQQPVTQPAAQQPYQQPVAQQPTGAPVGADPRALDWEKYAPLDAGVSINLNNDYKFHRADGFVGSIPQKFVDRTFVKCPICCSANPYWTISQHNQMSLKGNLYLFKCSACNGIISMSMPDVTTLGNGGSGVVANPSVGMTNLMVKSSSGKEADAVYAVVESVGNSGVNPACQGKEFKLEQMQQMSLRA